MHMHMHMHIYMHMQQVMQLDNRGSNFYVALYWAQALASHDQSFKPLADKLAENEKKIVEELTVCQVRPHICACTCTRARQTEI